MNKAKSSKQKAKQQLALYLQHPRGELNFLGLKIDAFPKSMFETKLAAHFPTIKSLLCDYNLFKTVPSEIQQFTALTTLNFGNNCLTEFPAANFAKLPLKSLDISNNPFKNNIIRPITNFADLTELNIRFFFLSCNFSLKKVGQKFFLNL